MTVLLCLSFLFFEVVFEMFHIFMVRVLSIYTWQSLKTFTASADYRQQNWKAGSLEPCTKRHASVIPLSGAICLIYSTVTQHLIRKYHERAAWDYCLNIKPYRKSILNVDIKFVLFAVGNMWLWPLTSFLCILSKLLYIIDEKTTTVHNPPPPQKKMWKKYFTWKGSQPTNETLISLLTEQFQALPPPPLPLLGAVLYWKPVTLTKNPTVVEFGTLVAAVCYQNALQCESVNPSAVATRELSHILWKRLNWKPVALNVNQLLTWGNTPLCAVGVSGLVTKILLL